MSALTCWSPQPAERVLCVRAGELLSGARQDGAPGAGRPYERVCCSVRSALTVTPATVVRRQHRVTAGSLFDFSAFCGFLSLYIIMTHRNNKEVVVTYYVEIPVVVYLKLTDVCLMRVWQVLEYTVISL